MNLFLSQLLVRLSCSSVDFEVFDGERRSRSALVVLFLDDPSRVLEEHLRKEKDKCEPRNEDYERVTTYLVHLLEGTARSLKVEEVDNGNEDGVEYGPDDVELVPEILNSRWSDLLTRDD